MGEAARRERQLKDMTVAQLTATLEERIPQLVTATVHREIQKILGPVREDVEKIAEAVALRVVQEAIKEYHRFLVENEQVRMVEPGSGKPKLFLPSHLAQDYYGDHPQTQHDAVTEHGVNLKVER